MAGRTLTYAQRNALAGKPGGALAPISGLPPKPTPSTFAALEAQTMGVLGTPKDGFDAVLAPLISALPAHTVQLAAMDKDIASAAFTPGAIVKTIYAPIGVNIAALAKAGDAQLADIGGAVGVSTGTPPPPGPQPCRGAQKLDYIVIGPASNPGGGGGGSPCPGATAKLAEVQAAVRLTALPTRRG